MSLHWLRVLLFLVGVQKAWGHGRLQEPPSRSSMWRFGFDTPHNYNDHELYCGGLQRQIRNGGKCGVCGDPWDMASPRPNEDGGTYGKGIVVRTYGRGQVIDVVVDITANHKGFFEFKLCPAIKSLKYNVTNECMNKHVLQMADGTGSRYNLPPDSRNQKFNLKVALPKHLTCDRCVFQWTYTAGNNWGKCEGGQGGMGCGHQETFRACADISILDETNDVNANNRDQSDESNDANNEVLIGSGPSSAVSLAHSLPLFFCLAVLVYNLF